MENWHYAPDCSSRISEGWFCLRNVFLRTLSFRKEVGNISTRCVLWTRTCSVSPLWTIGAKRGQIFKDSTPQDGHTLNHFNNLGDYLPLVRYDESVDLQSINFQALDVYDAFIIRSFLLFRFPSGHRTQWRSCICLSQRPKPFLALHLNRQLLYRQEFVRSCTSQKHCSFQCSVQ